LPDAFPSAAGPQSLATLVHPPVQLGPFRVSKLSTVPPTCRSAFDFLEFPIPPTVSKSSAPSWSELFQAHPGAAHRFSQPLSGFSRRLLRCLISCCNRSWDLPTACSPREKRAPFSGPLLPCSYPPACRAAPPSPYHRPFHRRPRPSAVAWIPGRLWASFPPTPKGRHPSRSGLRQRTHLFRRASPASKLCSSRESVRSRRESPHAAGRYAPGFHPLQSLLPQRLEASTRPTSR